MNDIESITVLQKIFKKTNAIDSQDIEIASTILNAINTDDRDYYVCQFIEWLAIYADIKYIDTCLSLVRPSRTSLDKYSAFISVAIRLIREKKYDIALGVLAEIEENATALEKTAIDNWQVAQAWEELADIYLSLEIVETAKKILLKAASVAQSGQNNETNLLDVKECSSILFAITKKMVKYGYYSDANTVAMSIKTDSWRKVALTELEVK